MFLAMEEGPAKADIQAILEKSSYTPADFINKGKEVIDEEGDCKKAAHLLWYSAVSSLERLLPDATSTSIDSIEHCVELAAECLADANEKYRMTLYFDVTESMFDVVNEILMLTPDELKERIRSLEIFANYVTKIDVNVFKTKWAESKIENEANIGTTEDSNEEDETTTQTSAISTALDASSEKSKMKNSEVETNSNESGSESETEDTTADTTQATDENEEPGQKLGEKLPSQRRVILFRHAERIDRVFPGWIRQANSNGTFRPYNSNHPKTLPKRRGGLDAYEFDPPITEIGKLFAQLAGKTLENSQLKISAIFSSPALRCIETAQIIAKECGMSLDDAEIKIEYGLFDWSSFYEIPPIFLTTTELMDAGINVDKSYRSIISQKTYYKDLVSETEYDYYRRSHDIIHKILTSTIGTVLIIGHATTIDSSSRALLELPKSIPSRQDLDRLADRYPYCASVIIEQSNQNGQWRLGKSLPPISLLNQTTKFDKKFLLRE